MERLLALSTIFIASQIARASPEEALLDWVASRGGEVHFRIERPCPTCLRGAVATRAVGAGEVVARVPANSTIVLGAGRAAEQAYGLLQRRRLDAAFEREFAPYLATLPAPEEVFAPEQYSDEDIAELQTPELERLVRKKREEVESLHSRKGPGAARISLGELKHMAGVVGSRKFRLLGAERLLLFDLLNHSEEPNTEFTDDGRESLLLLATRPIAEGEVLTDSYKTEVLHRGDASLFLYGFLEEQEQPLLCAVDLPSYNPHNPWRRTAKSDPQAAPGAPTWAQRREHRRLAALLESMPTTEQQDEQALAGGELNTWKQRLLVRFRLQRKRALRLALERMERAWFAHQAKLVRACSMQPGALFSIVPFATGVGVCLAVAGGVWYSL